jgi:hypothetical protein
MAACSGNSSFTVGTPSLLACQRNFSKTRLARPTASCYFSPSFCQLTEIPLRFAPGAPAELSGQKASKQGDAMQARKPARGLAALLVVCLLGGQGLAQQAYPAASSQLPAPEQLPAVPVPPPSTAPPNSPTWGTPVEASNGWLSGLFVDGEYWYVKPHSQAMDYAIANSAAGVPDGSVIYRDWDFRSAFRTGLGYRLPGQPWSLGFYYTYLHDAASGSSVAPDGGFLFATQTHPGTVSQVQTAAADTSLGYNVFDLELGRWCALTEAINVRVFGGGRFARIDQNFTASYNGGDANQDVVAQRLHFNGGGFRAGADAFWNLAWGFSLFGRASGSLVGGDFNSFLVETNNAGATTLTNLADHFEKVVPVAEMTMGVGWQYHGLRLTAGYTFINWFGLVNVPSFVDDVHQGKFVRSTSDLSLEGLILRAAWMF